MTLFPRKYFVQVKSAKRAALKPQSLSRPRQLSATQENSRRDARRSAKGTLKKADVKDIKSRLQMRSKWDCFPVMKTLMNTLPGPWRARIVPTSTMMKTFWAGYDEDHMAVDHDGSLFTPTLLDVPATVSAFISVFTPASGFAFSSPSDIISSGLTIPVELSSSTLLSLQAPKNKSKVVFESVIHSMHAPWRTEGAAPPAEVASSISLAPKIPKSKGKETFESVVHSTHAPWRIENGGTGIIGDSNQVKGGKGKSVNHFLQDNIKEEINSVPLPSVSSSTTTIAASSSILRPILPSCSEAFCLPSHSRRSPSVKETRSEYIPARMQLSALPSVNTLPPPAVVPSGAASSSTPSSSTPLPSISSPSTSPPSTSVSSMLPSSTLPPPTSSTSISSSSVSAISSSSSLLSSLLLSSTSSLPTVSSTSSSSLSPAYFSPTSPPSSSLFSLPLSSPPPLRPSLAAYPDHKYNTLPSEPKPESDYSSSASTSMQAQSVRLTVAHPSVFSGTSGGLSDETTECHSTHTYHSYPSVFSGTSGESFDETKCVACTGFVVNTVEKIGQEVKMRKNSKSSTSFLPEYADSKNSSAESYLGEWTKEVIPGLQSPIRFCHSTFGRLHTEEPTISVRFRYVTQQRNHDNDYDSSSCVRENGKAVRGEEKPEKVDKVPRAKFFPVPKKRQRGTVKINNDQFLSFLQAIASHKLCVCFQKALC
ncbi:hypothetical protein BDQ17DRAFT_1353188 [Cyathus striatus]|nr:hypothetical protein BDQ17DRAFT_1353188 [Cyathus striatus]